MKTTAPKVGTKFLHSRILTEDYSGPAVCEVSKVAKGCIWYRVNGSETAREYCAVERWPKICKEVLP